jgi:hypothetical protein
MTAAMLPEVLQSVVLEVRPGNQDDRAVEVDTKVLDIEVTMDEPTIVLSREPGIDGLTLAPHCAIMWTGLMGRVECPVALRTGRRDYGLVWLARPTGPPVRTQRRAYFRARMYAPVMVEWTEGVDDGAAVDHRLQGVAVDLSEGGVLATVKGGATPSSGTPVTVAVVLDGDTLEQPAVVVRHVDFPGGGSGLAVAFSNPSLHGDRVRRAAFEAERRRLLASRGGAHSA